MYVCIYIYICIMYTHSVGFSKEAMGKQRRERERGEREQGRKEGGKEIMEGAS
jgi:hypothetical protein